MYEIIKYKPFPGIFAVVKVGSANPVFTGSYGHCEIYINERTK